jgi:fatty acid synthase, animal type
MSEVVISGIAGRFPQSENVEEFKKNLLNKVYLVGDPENRIKFKFSRVANSYGLMKNLEKFDYGAFCLPRSIIGCMDPQGRIVTEHVYEAIIDAGVSPKSLSGSRTGVFVGCINYESLEHWMYNEDVILGLASIGNTAYSLSNRISYIYGFQGPSLSGELKLKSFLISENFINFSNSSFNTFSRQCMFKFNVCIRSCSKLYKEWTY